MSRLNDVGGVHGFGPVEWDPDAPVFGHAWEAQTYAVVVALVSAGHFTLDEFRHAMERIDPRRYYATAYYERFVAALETLVVEKGLVPSDALAGPH